jgi:hypothetical protein
MRPRKEGKLMKTMIYGAAFTAMFSSHALCEPDGVWSGCPWGPSIAAINSVVLWDQDDDGPLPAVLYMATDDGIYFKAADGAIHPLESFEGDRITAITTWDQDGDGPLPTALVFTVQESAFADTEVRSLVLEPDGVVRGRFFGVLDSDVRGLASYDTNGNETDELVVVGVFENLQDIFPRPLNKSAAFDGSNWSQLGTAPNSACEVAKVIPCSPANSAIPCEGDSTLVIGGFFTLAGGQNADGVACWDDSAGDWAPCGGGSGLSGTVVIRDVAGWESEEGPQLIVAGFGIQVNGVSAGNIAHFDGTNWLPFGDGAFGNVQAVTSFDVDGDGSPDPIMATVFNEGGGSFPYRAVFWDGSEWLPINGGEFTSDSSVQVRDMLSADVDGAGGAPPELIMVGQFDAVSSVAAENLAIWSPNDVGGPCNAADFAEPFGELSFFDVSAYLSLFAAQNPVADLNGDGAFNFFDVQIFVSAFVLGCP